MASEFELVDLAASERAGALIACWMTKHQGGVIFLSGALGAGKTSLARGLLRALGVGGPVRSPSYTLVEPYECDGASVLHMDLYRLRDPDELDGLGLRDFSTGRVWWLVEWPERGQGYLPKPDLWLHLSASVQGQGRRLRVQAGRLGEAEYSRLFSLLEEGLVHNRHYQP
ncbi:tRNA (adenosine(37)-N6)-threonylcarbamoyltransferase complex ATPase subunit type 1 TsaE [Solimonas terrae]|uniref:tRNA threonylcarbamoyladenosine biosynthesis protein TsaE n=1 Tax=Solimonas terrae TaxID=1396819 RepID=A0A6M2BLV5_9GAMM|nr:tRNA (adenosine(37)-N6)-threonylcarbamoyltransferase complex ATPase subunit type 1 TsaE [Solimonas terrae]NGY03606.1 tRNA (adenosine(37)-N6)-threonylcarbamoyltransferase complex ATPase subunit type 1 TsaE [Solimonas terrae]